MWFHVEASKGASVSNSKRIETTFLRRFYTYIPFFPTSTRKRILICDKSLEWLHVAYPTKNISYGVSALLEGSKGTHDLKNPTHHQQIVKQRHEWALTRVCLIRLAYQSTVLCSHTKSIAVIIHQPPAEPMVFFQNTSAPAQHPAFIQYHCKQCQKKGDVRNKIMLP
jgi:hypothetical protein